mmetsp:Transcript_16074/g.35048  ORF Transcript_16074/g.35048 Transcript_16074/m.35048 type:complete len:1364 (+) Transcript_16074:87-4178(+)
MWFTGRAFPVAILVLLLTCLPLMLGQSGDTVSQFRSSYNDAVELIGRQDFRGSVERLLVCYQLQPQHVDTIQLLGVLSLKLGQVQDAQHYLSSAYTLNGLRDLGIVANYIEALRSGGRLQDALTVGYDALSQLSVLASSPFKDLVSVLFNLGIVERNLGNTTAAIALMRRAVTEDPRQENAWLLGAELLVEQSPREGGLFLLEAVAFHPQSHSLHFLLGTAYQHQHRLDEALLSYAQTERLSPEFHAVKGNIASTLQSLGRVQEAARYYEQALAHASEGGASDRGRAGLFNNYGALLGIMGRHEEEAQWLQRALDIEPDMEPALLNLGGLHQDDGDIPLAVSYLQRALAQSKAKPLLRLRLALMLSPVAESWEGMLQERLRCTRELQLMASEPSNATEKYALDTSLDRIHFYVAYHGLNDRSFQELVMSLYYRYLTIDYIKPAFLEPTFPSLSMMQDSFRAEGLPSPGAGVGVGVGAGAGSPPSESRKVKIGFMSKFFGLFEPHGMLLDGVMKHLPRSQFTVYTLPVARSENKPLSPSVAEASDHLVVISLTYSHALETLSALGLDVLVIADTMSEPMTHFLAHARVAPIQMAFWGNPLTSGSRQVDYFVSSDFMEHPFRTRMPLTDEPYTEQVVLLEGQGIWYSRPSVLADLVKVKMDKLVAAPKNYSRASFGLQEDWFVYVLPQSVFKIHPLYDLVLRDILHRVPRGHLAVTGGRRPRWTRLYYARLQAALGPLSSRLHMLDRVSSEQFTSLLKIADVVLHPFPFDGSKTSADALYAGRPMVTLPTEYLRGRMGASFLRTMNLPQLAARSRSEYVDIAARLCLEPAFHQQMVAAITHPLDGVDLIWEDMSTPYRWYQFLSAAAGLPTHPLSDFLLQTGRDVQKDMERTRRREHNGRLFDEQWGRGEWLLDAGGVARLETVLNSTGDGVPMPRIFRDGVDARVVAPVAPVTASTAEPARPTPATPATPPTPATPVAVADAAPGRGSYLALVDAGRYEEARVHALAEYAQPQSQSPSRFDPLFLLELGAIHIFLNMYQEGAQYCREALPLAPRSSLLHACLGVAAMYIAGQEDSTIATFMHARKLKIAELILNATDAEAGRAILYSRVFKAPMDALENNLLSSFRIFKRHEQCLAWCRDSIGLPAMDAGGAYILVFALVQWSQGMRADIAGLESLLRQRGSFSLPASVTLWGEVLRVQETAKHMVTVANECLSGLSSAGAVGGGEAFLDGILRDMMVMVGRAQERSRSRDVKVLQQEWESAHAHANAADGGISSLVVLVQQFFSPQDASKVRDISDALLRNLQNPAIGEVHLLNEREYDFSPLHPWDSKIRQHVVGERLTFSHVFAYANQHLQNRTVVLGTVE